jgi:hypothetical protein
VLALPASTAVSVPIEQTCTAQKRVLSLLNFCEQRVVSASKPPQMTHTHTCAHSHNNAAHVWTSVDTRFTRNRFFLTLLVAAATQARENLTQRGHNQTPQLRRFRKRFRSQRSLRGEHTRNRLITCSVLKHTCEPSSSNRVCAHISSQLQQTLNRPAHQPLSSADVFAIAFKRTSQTMRTTPTNRPHSRATKT